MVKTEKWHIYATADGEFKHLHEGSVRQGRTFRRARGIARWFNGNIVIAKQNEQGQADPLTVVRIPKGDTPRWPNGRMPQPGRRKPIAQCTEG